MRTALALVASLVLVGAGSLVAPGAAAQEVTAIIDGPSALGTGRAGSYNVTVGGGPGAEGGNFSLVYWLTGADLTGARPTESTPGAAPPQNGTRFLLNVTAPATDQTVTFVVEVNSTKDSAFATTRVTKSIAVVTPVTLSATFRNASPVSAINVTVDFSVDGDHVGRTTIRIDPGGIGVATLSWLPVGLTPGAHTVTATADLNGDGRIDPELGEAQVTSPFYRNTPELPWGLIVLFVGAILLVGFIANAAIRRRRLQRP